jgi:hypothetical protein
MPEHNPKNFERGSTYIVCKRVIKKWEGANLKEGEWNDRRDTEN